MRTRWKFDTGAGQMDICPRDSLADIGSAVGSSWTVRVTCAESGKPAYIREPSVTSPRGSPSPTVEHTLNRWTPLPQLDPRWCVIEAVIRRRAPGLAGMGTHQAVTPKLMGRVRVALSKLVSRSGPECANQQRVGALDGIAMLRRLELRDVSNIGMIP